MTRRRCTRCLRLFVLRRAERVCGCPAPERKATCSECGCEFVSVKLGRPRRTCNQACAASRNHRLSAESLREDMADATSWWLDLSHDQRAAAMAWAKANPPGRPFPGGRQLWAYFNRAAFSCEQRVVSGVR